MIETIITTSDKLMCCHKGSMQYTPEASVMVPESIGTSPADEFYKM